MTELSRIELLERLVNNNGVMTIQDLKDAQAILRADGSELTWDPEDLETPSMDGPE